ncbi:MAG: acyl-CoA dehydrogenase [Alphaproteobacteria bacterium]|nr:acyl-CoA dehydrogenase [Alphaproteobacteria bacterium]
MVMTPRPVCASGERRTLDDLLGVVAQHAGAWRDRALATERARQPLPETTAELFATGLMRMFVPARFGGAALDWDAPVALGRAIGRVCPSTAWMVGVVGAHAAWVGRYPGAAQEEVWGDGADQLLCGAMVAKGGRIRRDGEGYRVSGAFGFASGIDHAKWGFVMGSVEGSTEQVSCLMPRTDWDIADTWFVSGMSGTGTKDIVVHDAYVPPHRAVRSADLLKADPPGATINREPIYRAEYGPYVGSSLLGPILGAAEGAMDAYLAITRERKGMMFGDRVAESANVQSRLAESTGDVRAAALMTEDQMRTLVACSRGDARLSEGERLMFARDRAYVARRCSEAVERLVKHMGASGLYDDNPVQRFHRDLQAMAQQIGVNWDRNMLPFARWLIGGASQDHSNWRR